MVGVVTGAGLGLESSSGWVLGSRGQVGQAGFGRAGENVYVNAANGNLVIQNTDEILTGLGPDAVLARTYNSQGLFTDDNGDNWRPSVARKVSNLTGGYGVAGSTVTRTDWDGSEVVYAWDAGKNAYMTSAGAGAFDKLTKSGTTWTWTDGDSLMVDKYDDASGGRIISSSDRDNNVMLFAYGTNGLVSRVTTKDGNYTDFIYSTVAGLETQLLQLRTTYTDLRNSPATTETQTLITYGYDASNRLTSVTVDLTPDNDADSVTYTTTYTYVGATKRVATITETDGSSLTIGYTEGSGVYRVTSLAQTSASGVTRTTNISYDLANRITTITDPASQATKLTYDTAGQLIQVEQPPAVSGAAAQVTLYEYDAATGDMTKMTTPDLRVTNYAYVNGNLTSERDSLGNMVTRTYDATTNRLLTETRYLVPDPGDASSLTPSQPLTTRYVYDGENHLAFTVSAEGLVTEYAYTGAGSVSSQRTYLANSYDVSALGVGDPIALSAMTAWTADITDKSTTKLEAYTYDFRGNLATTTRYATVQAGGAGDSVGRIIVTYVYDQAGRLLSRVTTGIANVETFVYDGLDRLVSMVDLNGGATTTVFNDTSRTTTVTLANGLVQTSTYNRAGELITYEKSGTGIATGTTNYVYDNLGRLIKATDVTNACSSYFLYDAVGRKVADVAADGSITEYGYDAADRLVKTISYATRVDSTGLSALAAGTATLAGIRPGQVAGDVWSWRIYDGADRLVETIDGKGGAVVFTYDGAGQLTSTKSYYNVIASGTVTNFKTTTPTTLQLPSANSSRDIVSRNFYDKDGRLVGVLDGAGYLRQNIYNAAGQVLETVAYATVTASNLRANGTFAELLTSVGTNAADQRTRYFYDGRGLLKYVLDANLRPTEYVYNTAGLVLHQTDYGASITSTGAYSLSYVAGEITSLGLAAHADTRNSWSVYDSAGRLAYAIGALGHVTKFTYDAVGQIAKQQRYSVARTTTSDPSLSTMNSWATSHAGDAGNRVSRMVYDKAGRVVYALDAENYVTEYRYDTSDRMTLEVRYADAYAPTEPADGVVTVADMLAVLPGTIPASAVQKSFSYDANGRLSDSFDGVGAQTHIVYDALGRVSEQTVAYGTPDAATTQYAYDAAGRLASVIQAPGGSEQATVSYTYDGMGNRLTMVDGRGFTTSYAYDTRGQVASVTTPIASGVTAITYSTYDAFGNLTQVTDPRGNIGTFEYDKLNRLVRQVDPEGYQTLTTYTIGGAVKTVTREGVTTTFTRDKLDRLTGVTDAENFTESYTLDAFGNRLTVTNKLGGVTTNTYDKRGLLLHESKAIAWTKADGTAGSTTVVTRYKYDGRGNLTEMYEGLSSTSALDNTALRKTIYTYDKANRVTAKTGDQVTIVNSATNLSSTETATPTETYVYDRRGNLTQVTDATGARMVYFYDDLNRRTMQVDALGAIRTWVYDDNGNVTSEKAYDTTITQPQPTDTKPTPSGAYRETTYAYDRANRLTTTTVNEQLRTGTWNGAYFDSQVGTLISTRAYDKAGNLVKETDAAGAATYYYYDALGRVIAKVDAELYMTAYVLDAEGNVTSERRFATKVGSVFTDAVDPTGLTDPKIDLDPDSFDPAIHADDRWTTFTYDDNGRRLTETRHDVIAWSVNAADGVMSQVGGAGLTDVTIAYSYNALGQVTQKVEAGGDTTDYQYDNSGRLVITREAAFTDYAGTANVRPLTENTYDRLSNLTQTRVMKSVVGANPTYSATNDRITTFVYAVGGRLTSMTDAANFTRSFGYDAAGRVLKEEYSRLKSDGSSVTEASAWRYDALGRAVFEAKAGWNTTTSSWDFGDATHYRYNVFGEVTGKGLTASLNGQATPVYQETFDYDAGGRMWRSNSGDGVVRFYFQDKAGRTTLTVAASGTTDISGDTLTAMVTRLTNNNALNVDIGEYDAAGVAMTFATHDKRGQQLATTEPFRQLSKNTNGTFNTTTIIKSRTYNAFGEVTSETDARDFTTDFAYNTMGRLIQKQSPLVEWTQENGLAHDNADGIANTADDKTRPTEKYYYDVSGRLIGVQDANAVSASNGSASYNTNRRTLLAGSGHGGAEALVTAEFRADNAVFRTGYDAFGDARKLTNELSKVELRDYDKMGRLITLTRPTRSVVYLSNPAALVENYTYDGLGQRLTHWNNQLGSSVKEKADYDVYGRITSTTSFAGHATTYAYAWDATIATSGLGTFGGWTKSTTNVAAKTATTKTDYFGRTVARTDYGNHSYNYTFDKAGRNLTQTGGAGQSMSYSWFNTGRLAGSVDGAGNISPTTNGFATSNITSTYAYDAAGNRTAERYDYTYYTHNWSTGAYVTTSTGTQQNATATYDALNRLTSFVDVGDLFTTTVNYKYDQNSNVRHVQALSTQHSNSVTTTLQSYWYRYDSMDRFVTTKGGLSGTAGAAGTTIVRGSTGADITYDAAGQRAQSTYTHSETVWTYDTDLQEWVQSTDYYDQRDSYAYTEDGFLYTVNIAQVPQGGTLGSGTLRVKNNRDAMGRVALYTEYEDDGTTVAYDRLTTYSADSRITAQTTNTRRPDGKMLNTVSDYYYNLESSPGSSQFTGAYQGVVTGVRADAQIKQGSTVTQDLPISLTKTSYQWWDQARRDVVTHDADINASNTIDTSTFKYDANGQLTWVKIQDADPRTVTFKVDAEGQVLSRNVTSDEQQPYHSYLYLDGMQIRHQTNDGDPDEDYVSVINNRYDNPTGPLGPDLDDGFHYGESITFNDFDQSYDPINGDEAQTATSYVVREGDTLQAVALTVWGDASMWWLIADANGLDGTEPLAAGMVLSIPGKVVNVHNNSDTFRIYDPNRVVGDVYPTNPHMPKPPKNSCGIAQILIAAIAIAVMVVVAPHAIAAMTKLAAAAGFSVAAPSAAITAAVTSGAAIPTVAGTAIAAGSSAAIAGAVAGGAMAGAAASLVSQGVGMALGLQDRISWNAVGISALSAGFSSGLAAGGPLAGGGWRATVARGAVGNALTQGVARATGMQDRFDWTGVAVAGVTHGVGGWVGAQLGNYAPHTLAGMATTFVSGMAAGVAGAAARSLIEGSDFGDNLIAVLPDAIASTIGNAVASKVTSRGASSLTEDGDYMDESWERQVADALGGEVFDRIAAEYWTGENPNLGSLSKLHESGKRGPGAISHDPKDPGGASYGLYQFSTTSGTLDEFLKSSEFSAWRSDFKGLQPGSATFDIKWRETAKADAALFGKAQHDFIYRTKYLVQLSTIKRLTGFDFSNHSYALQDVIWSTAVQHGQRTDLIARTINAMDLDFSTASNDGALINAIYAERARTTKNGRLANFPRVTDARRIQALKTRFSSERLGALQMLRMLPPPPDTWYKQQGYRSGT